MDNSDSISAVDYNYYWVCPICSLKFKWYEVLASQQDRDESLAVHLYLVHEKELRKRHSGDLVE